MPYCHPRLRPALSAIAAGAGKVTVEIRRFTDERSLLELDRDGQATGAQVPHLTNAQHLAQPDALVFETDTPAKEPVPVQPVKTAMDRMEADWFNMDSRHVVHEPALPSPAPTPPQPPVPALVAAPVPHENRPVHRANGNGTSTTQPQRVNGHPRRVNGAVVRRSDDEIRNISDRRRVISNYPATHPVHGIV